MCRLYTLKTNPRILAEIFGVEFPALPGELFKTTHKVVAVRHRDGLKEAALFHWGLIPQWAKDKKEGSSKVNARAETVAELNSYRVPFKRKRCLMPASAFYEYKEIGKAKEPHLTAARCLDCRDVDLFHRHHRIERALGDSGIGVADRFRQGDRRDLPGQASLVLAPAALALFAAVADDGLWSSVSRDGDGVWRPGGGSFRPWSPGCGSGESGGPRPLTSVSRD